MISPDEALARVMSRARPLTDDEAVPLDVACGRVLAQDVLADRDNPSFDRVCMDGFAGRCDSIGIERPSPVVLEVRAGYGADRSVGAGQLARVMTGAPLPPGTDTVIPQEQTRVEGDLVRLLVPPTLGQHVATRGSDCRSGDRVLARGTVLRPQGIAALASVGQTIVRVIRQPRLAIVSTGDEIVPMAETPGPFQIRNSNAHSLMAQARSAGFTRTSIDHAPDEEPALMAAISRALEADVVVITGGVSLGRYDLVPAALERVGVERDFHEVAQQPAKPMWFGHTATSLVFGAPGNPLATVLTFDRYALPALRILAGLPAHRALLRGRLTREVQAKKGNRDLFVFAEARAHPDTLEYEIRPLMRTGAADVFNTALANAVIRLRPGDRFTAGEEVAFTLLGFFEAMV